MKIHAVAAFNDNYIWMIINHKAQTAICVDPGDAQPVLTFLAKQSLHLDTILLTHHHQDHIGGVAELLQHYPQTLVYGPSDSRIQAPLTVVKDNDQLPIDNYNFEILGTTGHTSTHISYYEPQQQWLFCGDTLFSAGCGRVFDGSIEALYESLQAFKRLPDHTEIYCAHEYTRQNLRFAAKIEPDNRVIRSHALKLMENQAFCSLPSCIALEKQINPFLRTNTAAVKKYALENGYMDLDPLSIFKQLRAEKDVFT